MNRILSGPRILSTIVGVAIIGAGLYAWVALPDRGDIAALVLVCLGGFFVSKSLLTDALKAAGGLIGKLKGGGS